MIGLTTFQDALSLILSGF